MRIEEPTLKERADHLYRRLLLLQRVFPVPRDLDEVESLGTGDTAQDLALCAGIREVLDELTEHARILTSVPSPLSEWRPGDRPDDERWRALTELERREVLSMVSSYENLISWGEGVTCRGFGFAGPGDSGNGEYLSAERARVARFRQEMGFLEKRRNGD